MEPHNFLSFLSLGLFTKAGFVTILLFFGLGAVIQGCVTKKRYLRRGAETALANYANLVRTAVEHDELCTARIINSWFYDGILRFQSLFENELNLDEVVRLFVNKTEWDAIQSKLRRWNES